MTRYHSVLDASDGPWKLDNDGNPIEGEPPDPLLVAFTAGEEAAADAATVVSMAAAVDDERDRRRFLDGLAVTTSPTGSFSLNMDATSQANIQGLVSLGMYLSSAAPTQTTVFRDYANTDHNLLPTELIAMGLQVGAHIQALYQKSWALKAMSPIPADYADDSFWH